MMSVSYADNTHNQEIRDAKNKRQALKRRKVQANGAHRFFNLLTQLSPWHLQTSVGLPVHLVLYLTNEPFLGRGSGRGMYNFYTASNEEVFQIGLGRCNPFDGSRYCADAYSLGAFHATNEGYEQMTEQQKRNSGLLKHELGHAQASSLMGPLYVPLILLSYYITENRGTSMFEGWADLAYHQSGTPLIRSYQLRLGTFTDNNNGEDSNRVGFKIQETRVRENYAALEEKMWEFLNISMNAPIDCIDCISVPEFTLYRDKTRFQGRVGRNHNGHGQTEPVVQVHMSGGNRIGQYTNDNNGGHQITAIGWSGRYGLMYVPTRAFKLYIAGGAAASIASTWNDQLSVSDLNIGYNAEAGMIILDTVQINAIYERLHGLVNGTQTTRASASIGTTPSGEENYRLHMNGGIQSNTVEDETGRVIYDSNITGVQLGINF